MPNLFTAQLRYAKFYLHTLQVYDEAYTSGGEHIELALKRFDIDSPNIFSAHTWSVNNAESDRQAAEICANFPKAGAHILLLRLFSEQQISWLESALAAARALELHELACAHLVHLGSGYLAAGQTRAAIERYEQALEITAEVQPRDYQGAVGALMCNLGIAYSSLGEVKKGIGYLEQALQIASQANDLQAQSRTLNNLGILQAKIGDYQAAKSCFEQSLDIAERLGDLLYQGYPLNGLGSIYASLGEHDAALEIYGRSLGIKRLIGDTSGEINTLLNLGNLMIDLSRFESAQECLEQALQLTRLKTKNVRTEAKILGALGNMYEQTGDNELARNYYLQQLERARLAEDKLIVANALADLGSLDVKAGDAAAAIKNCEHALSFYREAGDKEGEGEALFISGLAHKLSASDKEALECVRAALSLLEQVGSSSVNKVRLKLIEWKKEKRS